MNVTVKFMSIATITYHYSMHAKVHMTTSIINEDMMMMMTTQYVV